MVTLIRVEAEGPALTNVARDLDKIAQAFGKEATLNVHDEHYERVHDSLFKGRRVYRLGEKRVASELVHFDSSSSTVTLTPTA